MTVQLDSATPGDARLEFRPSNGDGDWVDFASDTGLGQVDAGESTITATLPIDAPTGTADLRVTLDAPGGQADDLVDDAIVVEPAPDLLTGFELRDGQDWTGHEEELDFLAELADRSDRVDYEQVGQSLEGRPIHLVRVGYPAPPAVEEAAEGRSVLFLGSQHGGEPSGREAVLQVLRELAFTDDPDTVAQLEDTTVLVVPTANPDGRAAKTRGNAEGVDTNRDHLTLETPEGRTMARVMRDSLPDVVADLHDNGTNESQPRPGQAELESGWARNLNTDEAVHDLSEDLVRDWVLARASDRGFTTGVWGAGAAAAVTNASCATWPDCGTAWGS